MNASPKGRQFQTRCPIWNSERDQNQMSELPASAEMSLSVMAVSGAHPQFEICVCLLFGFAKSSFDRLCWQSPWKFFCHCLCESLPLEITKNKSISQLDKIKCFCLPHFQPLVPVRSHPCAAIHLWTCTAQKKGDQFWLA